MWELDGYGEMIIKSGPVKFTYRGQMRDGVRHGRGIMKIMSGVREGEHYWSIFDMDVEDKKSRRSLLKEKEEEEEEYPSPGGGGRMQTKRRVVKYSKRRVVKYSQRRGGSRR